MNESEFLEAYDPGAFEHPSVAVDLVLMSVADGAPAVLLLRRTEHPHRGRWALPGGFVGVGESLEDAARRVLRDKVPLDGAYLEQLYTFGAVDRDPRTRVVSVAYFALLPPERLLGVRSDGLEPARLVVPWAGEAGGPVEARSGEGEALPLAFDHADMLGMAVLRLRGKLGYSPVAFALLPARFTLRALQDVHEAIRGRRLNKPAFRRRMLDRGWLRPTGERETGASFRPAELYEYRPPVAGEE